MPVIPSEGGLYAWWGPAALLPDSPGPGHPTSPDWRLIYIGNGVDLHKRLVRTHLRERSGQSAVRRVLAAVVSPSEGWGAVQGPSWVQVAETDEARVTGWMRKHLAITWTVTPEHADVERAVIALMQPPLNHRHNRSHRRTRR